MSNRSYSLFPYTNNAGKKWSPKYKTSCFGNQLEYPYREPPNRALFNSLLMLFWCSSWPFLCPSTAGPPLDPNFLLHFNNEILGVFPSILSSLGIQQIYLALWKISCDVGRPYNSSSCFKILKPHSLSGSCMTELHGTHFHVPLQYAPSPMAHQSRWCRPLSQKFQTNIGSNRHICNHSNEEKGITELQNKWNEN